MTGAVVVEGSAARRAAIVVGALVAGVVLVVAVLATAPGHEERFGRSMAAMQALAHTIEEGDTLTERTVGELTFTSISRVDGLVYFQEGIDLGGEPVGYVWSPAGEPDDARHVTGPWYQYRG
ncbi:hypothetical protein HII36_06575 [Nonomuraea sp. NN258]|uniref:hypothetical protein n=1 Tax=Nonomuraea antri TaxID=2730852 RepID=UPI0015682240|nr:hypothetical protein [Nonomuraea antri]NRQ31506.1 hypothetical protein [Nonomuraea antri]